MVSIWWWWWEVDDDSIYERKIKNKFSAVFILASVECLTEWICNRFFPATDRWRDVRRRDRTSYRIGLSCWSCVLCCACDGTDNEANLQWTCMSCLWVHCFLHRYIGLILVVCFSRTCHDGRTHGPPGTAGIDRILCVPRTQYLTRRNFCCVFDRMSTSNGITCSLSSYITLTQISMKCWFEFEWGSIVRSFECVSMRPTLVSFSLSLSLSLSLYLSLSFSLPSRFYAVMNTTR